jgi:hypothetical protein
MPDMTYVQGYASDSVLDQDIADAGWSANERLSGDAQSQSASTRRLKVALLCDTDLALKLALNDLAAISGALNFAGYPGLYPTLRAISEIRHTHFNGASAAQVLAVVGETGRRNHCDHTAWVKDIIDTADRLRSQPNG